VVENLREMGLSYSEIGRFFTFLGHELCERASQEEEPHGQSLKPFGTGESTGAGPRVPINYAQWAFRECRAAGAAVLRPAVITPADAFPEHQPCQALLAALYNGWPAMSSAGGDDQG